VGLTAPWRGNDPLPPEKPHGLLFNSAPDGSEYGKDSDETSAGTRWIIGGRGGSVKPSNHEFCVFFDDFGKFSAIFKSKKPLVKSGFFDLKIEAGF
jgi:hypothetical protein